MWVGECRKLFLSLRKVAVVCSVKACFAYCFIKCGMKAGVLINGKQQLRREINIILQQNYVVSNNLF